MTLGLGAWRLDTITAASTGDEALGGTVPAGTRTELAAAVVLSLIGALGGLVARIEEHPLVTLILAWPRRLAALAAMLPFVAAGSLIVGPLGRGAARAVGRPGCGRRGHRLRVHGGLRPPARPPPRRAASTAAGPPV